MKPMKSIMILIFGLMLMACGGGSGSDTEPGQTTADLSSQEQAELVATALSAQQGGVEDDIARVSQAATGTLPQHAQMRDASFGFTVSVNIDFYDAQDNLQQAYDPQTTDRIDYQSLIQGQITNDTGFFRELSIDNQSDFTVRDILSGLVWINGSHTNHSSYRRIQPITQADVHFQLDSELILTDVTVDLQASDTFPESGTIEGTLSGSCERVAPNWQQTTQFNFHFVATYLGDNTAEVELDDGTIFTVHLDNGTVQDLQ